MLKLYDRYGHRCYSARTLAANTDVVDAGPVDLVMERAGLEPRGDRRKAFIKEAQGKIVLRVLFDMVILTDSEARLIASQLSR